MNSEYIRKKKNYIIDVETHDKARIIRRLRKLKSTKKVSDGGEYWQDKSYSQIWLTSTETIKEIDDWLYTYGFYYVGVVEQEDEDATEEFDHFPYR